MSLFSSRYRIIPSTILCSIRIRDVLWVKDINNAKFNSSLLDCRTLKRTVCNGRLVNDTNIPSHRSLKLCEQDTSLWDSYHSWCFGPGQIVFICWFKVWVGGGGGNSLCCSWGMIDTAVSAFRSRVLSWSLFVLKVSSLPFKIETKTNNGTGCKVIWLSRCLPIIFIWSTDKFSSTMYL